MKLILISILILKIFCQVQLKSQFLHNYSIDNPKLTSSYTDNQIEYEQPLTLQAKMNIQNQKLKNQIKDVQDSEKRRLISTNIQYFPSQGLKMTYRIFEYMAYFALLISVFSSKLIGLQLFGVIQFSFLIMANFPSNYSSINVFSSNKLLNGYNLQKVLQDYNSQLPNSIINNGYTSSLFAVNFNIMFAVMILLIMIWLILGGIISLLESKIQKQNNQNTQNSQQIIAQETNLSLVTDNQKKSEAQTSNGFNKINKSNKFSNQLNKQKFQQEISIDNSLQQKSSKYNQDYILQKQLKEKQTLKKLKHICLKIEYFIKRQFFVFVFIFTLPNAAFSCGLQLYYQVDVIFQVQKISVATISGLLLLLYFIVLGVAFYILCTHERTKYQYGQLKIKLRTNNWGKSYLLVLTLQSFIVNTLLAFLNDSNICSFLILTINILFLGYIIGLQPYKKNIQNYRSTIINSGKSVITIINIIYRNCSISEQTDLTITILEFCFLFILISITFGFLIRQICYGCVADTQLDFQEKLRFLGQNITQTEGQQFKRHGVSNVHLIKVGNAQQSQNISNITHNENESHISLKKINKKSAKNVVSQKKVTNIDDQQIEQNYYRNQARKETQNLNNDRIKKIKLYLPKKKKVGFNQQNNLNQKSQDIQNNKKQEQVLDSKTQKKQQKRTETNQNNQKSRIKILNNQRIKKTFTKTMRIDQYGQDRNQKENISFKQL